MSGNAPTFQEDLAYEVRSDTKRAETTPANMPTTTAAPPTSDHYARYGLADRIYWTPRDLAPILDRSVGSIRESARSGHLRSRRQPGRTRPRHVYHRDEVVAWLDGELDVTPEPAPQRAEPARPEAEPAAKEPRKKRSAKQDTAPAVPVSSKDGIVRDGLRVVNGVVELF